MTPPLVNAEEAARRLFERWQDPVLFAHEALGIERIWDRQAEMLRTMAAHQKVSVKAGQKASKSLSLAIFAVWYAMMHRSVQVILLAPSWDHLDKVLWTEITRIREASYDRSPRRTRKAVLPLGGTFHLTPSGGWSFPNGSEIVGAVTNDPGKIRGFSGADNCYICDESSGIADPIFASIDGNLAGGGKIVAVSNPVTCSGWYAETFPEHNPKTTWTTLTISSLEAAAVDPPIKGLATQQFIDEKRIEWGEASPEWHSKVLGNFPPATADGVIPRALADAAASRWTTTPQTDAPLRVGVDVARFGTDKSVIVWSRGLWASTPIVLSGCDVVEVSDAVLEVIGSVAKPGEKALVHIDAVSVGGGVADILRRRHDVCTVVDVQAAGSSPDPRCSRMRDAVWLSLQKWLQTGAIPRDMALITDLTAPSLGYDPANNKFKVEGKREMRQRIGRSTDRADALALAVYQSPAKTWDASIGSRTSRAR